MKLEQDDIDRICTRVVDHDMDTKIVAEQFDISRRRVQQLAKQYRESGDLPHLDTPGRKPYADYPADLEARILEIYRAYDFGAEAVSHVLRVRDGLTIDTNHVHDILEEYEHVTDNPTKQGRQRPWVRFERDYAGVTVHIDWYQNDRGDHVLGVEDDASRFVFDMLETDASSATASVDLLDSVRDEYETTVPILEVITDHGAEFVAPHQDERPCLDHAFERYLHDNDIRHSLCAVGRPQSNGKIERFFQTYEKHRWRLGSLQEFLDFYNKERPHMSLTWDELETPYEAYDRLQPDPHADIPDLLSTEVTTDD